MSTDNESDFDKALRVATTIHETLGKFDPEQFNMVWKIMALQRPELTAMFAEAQRPTVPY